MKRLHSRAKTLLSHNLTRVGAACLVIVALIGYVALAYGQHPRYIEVGYTSTSPSGQDGGQIVPASCELGYYHDTPWFGQSCTSASNSCGQVNYGSYDCGGNCTASTPANPWYLGQSCTTSNACGQVNYGTYNCSGQCSASAPANPSYYGGACQATNACGMSSTGTYNCSDQCTASAPSNSLCPAPSTCIDVTGSGDCGEGTGGGGSGGGTGSGSSTTVLPGTSVTIVWSCPSPNTSASGVNFSTGGAVSGTAMASPTTTTTYTVVCDQTTTQGSVQALVINPTLFLQATPTRVPKGSTAQLTWYASSVESCTLGGPNVSDSATADGNGNVGTSGSPELTTTAPVTGQSTYTLSCQTVAGPVSTSVTISIIPTEIEI